MRWRDAALAAAIPDLARRDLAPFWSRFDGAAPPLLRFAMRTAAWTLAALCFLDGRRDRALRRLAASRVPACRQLAWVVKTLACLAYFRGPQP